MSDLVELGVVEAADAIRRGEVSPVELTEDYLRRIEETEPLLNAYTTVAIDQARAAARAAEAAVSQGAALGPLHGIPVGVKDVIDTAGLRTTYGSPRWESHVPRADATVVTRLRNAGAVILGKHATHELAWGGRTDSAHFGPTHNPHREGHIPGGSSGGSAASVVARSCLAAIGTDTAGSVRIPAALSGCVGFKPTRGRLSRAGVLPLAPALDHVGVLARTALDAAVVVAALEGSDPADPGSVALPALNLVEGSGSAVAVAFPTGWTTELLDPGVASMVDGLRLLLAQAGMAVHQPELAGAAPTDAALQLILAEAGDRHRPDFEDRPDDFGADLAGLLSLPSPTPRELAQAQMTCARASAALQGVLLAHDVVVMPTVATTAPRIGQLSLDVGQTSGIGVEQVLTRLTSIANVAGLPAVSVPIGQLDGLPVGVQVIGRPGDDATALSVASTIERITS